MRGLHRIRRIFELPVDEDVRKELAFHLAMRTRELEEAGWEPVEARREAERLFGDLGKVATECRVITQRRRQARRRADMFDALWQDLRYGARALLKNPGFTAVALLTLALGVGATSALFTVVRGVLLSPLPYPDPERLVTLWEVSERGHEMHVPHANFADWRERAGGFDGMAVYSDYGAPITVLGGDVPLRAVAVPASRDFFPVLGVEPLAGRTFLEEESRLGADPAVVVSYGFWRRHLGAAPDLEGLTLRFSGRVYRVVGVMPPGFAFPEGAELWYPAELGGWTPSRTAHNWAVVARLASGADLGAVRAEMNALAAAIKDQFGNDVDAVAVQVTKMRDEMVGGAKRPLWTLLGASLLVLLVAATNLASTLLARAVTRQREVAVRTAIGAGRLRIVRQLLTETVLLTTLGGIAGLGLAALTVWALKGLAPSSLPRLEAVTVDGGVLAFALALAVVVGLVFGLLPALKASRADLRGVISETAHRSAGARGGRTWNLLVASEVALALVLLVGSGLLIRSFRELTSVELGFTTDEVLTFRITVPGIATPDEFEFEPYRVEERKIAAFYGDFLPALHGVPGVDRVGFVNNLPLSGRNLNGAFVREGQPEEEYSNTCYRVVGGDYFAALGIPLVRGRLFNARDAGGPHVALVNETFAARYFPGEDPVGQRVRSFGMDLWWDEWMTVVGVVSDVRHGGFDREAYPELYVPYEQRAFRAGNAAVVVKASASTASVAGALRARVRERYPELPVDLSTFETLRVRSVEKERFMMLLLGSFAVLALALAAIGIYGVVSYSVAQRTREMGIRIALGAGPRDVVRLVMRQALAVVALGMAVGLGAALALGRTLESQLFGVRPGDPATLAATAAVLALAAVAASWVPARRTTGIDPLLAIRDE